MKWFKSLMLTVFFFISATLTIPSPSQADLSYDLLKLLEVEGDSHQIYMQRLNESLSKEKIVADESKISKLKELIQKGVDVNARDDDGMTALTKAVRGGRIEIARLLVDNGADVNAVEKSGYPVLIVAESMPFPSQIEIVRFLLDKGASPNSRGRDGWTALMESAKGHAYLTRRLQDIGHENIAAVPLEFAKMLIKHGADINAKYRTGETALMVAAGNGQVAIVKLLIESGADVNVIDNDGNTALLSTVAGFAFLERRGSSKKELKDLVSIPIEIIKLLIKKGAAVNARNKDGQTAYLLAVGTGLSDVAQSLRHAGGKLAYNPIFNLQERLQFQGFSVLPPQGEAWAIMDSDSKGITFSRHTVERLHTVMASARIKVDKETAVALKNHSDFTKYIKGSVGYDDERFRGLDIKISWGCYQSKECVKYDFTVEDHSSPYAPRSLLILNGYGFVLLHPDGNENIIDISCSERFPEGTSSIPIEEEIGPFFRSLEFSPVK